MDERHVQFKINEEDEVEEVKPAASESLAEGEVHPSSHSAMIYLNSMSLQERVSLKEALASTALSGDRQAVICLSTLERLEQKMPVSDRYLLGLAWLAKECFEPEEWK